MCFRCSFDGRGAETEGVPERIILLPQWRTKSYFIRRRNMTNTFVFRPINMKATGRRIRDCRTARNLTVEQLSTLFCISPQAVCKWQRGDALPTIDNLMVLCDLFQVKVEDLIVRDDDGSSVFFVCFCAQPEPPTESSA